MSTDNRPPDSTMAKYTDKPRLYTASNMRDAFIACWFFGNNRTTIFDVKAEAFRRWPDKEEK